MNSNHRFIGQIIVPMAITHEGTFFGLTNGRNLPIMNARAGFYSNKMLYVYEYL